MESGKSYIVEIKDTAAVWTDNYFFKINMITDDAPDNNAAWTALFR